MIFSWFWREWKTPSLIIVWLAMSLSVAAVLALGNLGDRLEQRLGSYNREFMAGDLVLRATRPARNEWLEMAESMDLKISQQLSFQTMAFRPLEDGTSELNDLAPLLVSIKATDDAYPLYGNLVTEPLSNGIQQGGVWVAPEVLLKLNLQVGDNLEIGDGVFLISGTLIHEPDAGVSGIQSAPKILMHLADIDKTGAVQLGSRLTYRYMFAGEEKRIEEFHNQLESKLPTGYRFIGESDAASGVGKTVDKAKQFLVLCSILTLLLSGSAVMVSMTHYTRTRYQLVAVLKTIGATRRTLIKWLVGQWLVLLILSLVTGGLLGLIAEQILLWALGSVLPPDLPKASFMPWVWAASSLTVIALIVGARPYVQLLDTPPIRILRQISTSLRWPLKIYLPIVIGILFLLIIALVGFNRIVWSVLFGIFFWGLLLGVIGLVLLKLLREVKTGFLPFKLAIHRLLHQPWITLSQLSAFSLSFMLLALLISMQNDLLARWQSQLPEETPSYVLMNIDPKQKNSVEEFWSQSELKTKRDYFTIVLARITELNEKAIKEALGENASRVESLNREINLTESNELPNTNVIIEGTWPPKSGETSIEQGVAEQLGVTLGDRITFDSGGRVFSAIVTSIRKVDWESMQLNFYFIFSEGELSSFTKMWVTPLILSSSQATVNETGLIHVKDNSSQQENDINSVKVKAMTEFSRAFPRITVLDVSLLITLANTIITQVSGALQFMSGLVIICGVLLMFAQVQVGMRQRNIELVVYRTLGASKAMLNQTLWIEFFILGAVAGSVAVIGAEFALYGLQSYVFDFKWEPSYKLWVITPLASSGLLMLCGWLLSRSLVNIKSNLRGLLL